MIEPVCLKCGKCCHFLVNEKIVKCGNLVKLKDGKTICRIYSTRIGKLIGHKMVCGFRSQSKYDFKDCPYNTNKPLFEDRFK